MEFVPLRVRIGLKPDGSADYPDFNTLAAVVASGLDWSIYIDRLGLSWQYERLGHDDDTAQSPRGVRFGLLLVPGDFADQAELAFPAVVTKLTEGQASSFYDNRHAVDIQDEEIDLPILNRIRRKQELGGTLNAQQLAALDPTSRERGVRENSLKTWARFKTKIGFTIRP